MIPTYGYTPCGYRNSSQLLGMWLVGFIYNAATILRAVLVILNLVFTVATIRGWHLIKEILIMVFIVKYCHMHAT